MPIMTAEKNFQGVQRRHFLKMLGAGLAAVTTISVSSAPLNSWFLTPQLPAQTEFGACQVRGTAGGQILQSRDEGQTWQALVSFGSHCAVQNLHTLNGQIFAQLSVQGYTFWLQSADAKIWRTLS
jgi:hypothetical protein